MINPEKSCKSCLNAMKAFEYVAGVQAQDHGTSVGTRRW